MVLEVTLKVNGKATAKGWVPAAMSLYFTGGNETFHIDGDKGSPDSFDNFDRAPFKINGTIGTTKIAYP